VRFAVDADAYDRFMGRYSVRLAPAFADFAQVPRASVSRADDRRNDEGDRRAGGLARETLVSPEEGRRRRVPERDARAGQDMVPGHRALDVGCGPGALATELVRRLGAAAVAAADPSEQFAAAARERLPGVDVRVAAAEELPFPNGEFDAALAQLVVHFMNDPVRGLAEMARVTREAGVVAACVWDHAGGQTPLAPFWDAVHELDSKAADESGLAGGHEGHLTELLTKAGLLSVQETALPVTVEHAMFEDWWEPFTLGVGPAGVYLTSLDPEHRTELRKRCNEVLGPGPFRIESRAWAARGSV
jgi:SAM-dependent methyltransferase